MKFKDITPFGVRFPTEVKEKLQKAANKNTRSLNAEIVARMTASFETRNALKEFTDGELIDDLIKRWGRENVFIRLGKEE
jgi:predicted transcriptional regulator